jgi:rubrerythrin
MVQVASVFLDGLEALDEIVHDEIARHEATSASIEIWPANGGEKHAWKRFITSRAETAQSEVPSPSGEEEQTPEETEEEQQQQSATMTANWFSCDGCGKKFRFHILLGVHKLHPCKTRGRKPLPVDPIMEVLPVPSNNGMLAIERVGNVEFPPLPSTRQEAAEKAEKAEKAAAAAAAAASTESTIENLASSAGTAEYVCDICGKVFPHNQGLAVHQTRWCIPEQQQLLLLSAQQAVGGGPAATTEEGPVNCPMCGKMFPTAQGLTIHQTRWCRGPEGSVDMDEDQRKVVGEQSSVIQVEPIYRPLAVDSENLIKIEETSEAAEHREPGVTPACYSLAGLSVAILWYRNKIETALSKFNSDKVHRSASARASRR